MPENEQRQPTAESHQNVTVTVEHKRVLRHTNTNRNYKTLYSGRYILNRNINGIKQIINRNFKKLW